MVARTEQFRVSVDQIFKDLDDIIRTQHIPVKRITKWWNINTVGITSPRQVFQELVERETTGCCVYIPAVDTCSLLTFLDLVPESCYFQGAAILVYRDKTITTFCSNLL
jgi:hypothetical protein